jgi:PAS domain S-box-containing protein
VLLRFVIKGLESGPKGVTKESREGFVGTSLAAEPLLALAVTVTAEQRVDSVLQSIVKGLASQPGVALARIWLLPSADLPSVCHTVSDRPDDLRLVASAGTPINSPREDWCFLQGHFARMPFNVGKVGQVAASRHPILIEDVATQNEWVVRPEWAKREEIRSFAGHPLIFRDKLLGVIAVFSRQPLGPQEFTWLGLFANQAALAISNACAERALRSRERNLGAIIDTIPTLAWCNLPDGSNEFLNKGWHEYTGLSPEESHGWGWQAALHPEDLPPLMEKWRKMLVSGESDEIEARLRRHDGVYRWFLIRAQALRNDSGKIVRWYGTSTDIEDLRQAQEARRASERNLAAIINTIPTTAWTTRPDGYCDFLNQGWLDYTGMTAEHAQGWGWAEAIHPDDRKRLIKEWQSCLASGTQVDTEARIRRFDSSYRWFLIRANPLRNESGNILKWYGTCIDIEGRKRGEETLRARELSWRQIVDNIPGLVATTGALGEIEFLNRQTVDYFGKTEELKDWALIGAVHPDDLPRVIEARKKSIEEGRIYEIEYRCRRADGVYRWFQVRGLPVRDAENKITAWYLLLTDIDDRKKAEEALQASERNLSLIINAIPALIHTARPDGYLDYFNRRWLEYLGCSLSDVEGWKWTTWIHPDDLQGILDKWRACLASGEIFEYETRVRRGDGEYRLMFHRKVPLRDEHGNIVRWYGTSLDIDDRRQAEAKVEQAYLRLAEAQRLSKTGSFITDLLADEHNWSEETFRIFGFDSATKVTVQMIRDMVHHEDLPTFDAVIARGMTGDDVDFVFRIVTTGGAVKHIRGMARVMTQIGGHPLFIGALQDVTESKIAEEALNKARSELAEVARITTLNALTASIAHEINQPLSGIITNASTCLRMLNGDPPNLDGARETARRTVRDGNRASDVITRLRALFSKKEFTLEPLDLNEATREVIALTLSDLQRSRVILLSELGEDLPPVIGDRVQLQQVILNLLRNASDAMSTVDDRQRELLIRTKQDEGDQVCLIVKDVGVGFTPEAADKLFQAFYTTKNDGMGIGLSVSRSIIERHRGRLWAEPNDGPGATFSFSIPCGPESAMRRSAVRNS